MSIPFPATERRMTRSLFKVLDVDRQGFLIPTKQAIACIALTGKIGISGSLYSTWKHLSSLRSINRVPYENPSKLLASMYPLDSVRFAEVFQRLNQAHLLHLYNDSYDGESNDSYRVLSDESIINFYRRHIDEDFDLLDKFTSDKIEAILEIRNYVGFFDAVMSLSLRESYFPLLPNAKIIADLFPQDQHLLFYTQLLESVVHALPNVIVSHANLHDIAANNEHIRALLIDAQQSIERPPYDFAAIVAAVNKIVLSHSTSYAPFILSQNRQMPNAHQFVTLDCDYGDEELELIDADKAVVFHRAITRENLLRDPQSAVELLFVYSKHIWIRTTSLADIARLFSGYSFESHDIIAGCTSVR